MKIQLALDRLTREKCFQVIKETEHYIDLIEVGTGVIKEYGMTIIREIKVKYPDITLVADMKTCDAGKFETVQAFEAGADITTVMAFSAKKTITDSLDEAEKYNKRIMVDLLGIQDQSKMIELEELGVDLVSLHFGKDMQQEGELPTDLFTLTNKSQRFEVAVAGGINLTTLPDIIKKNPDIIIVGSAITQAENMNKVASEMKGLISKL
ncbi:3-hexulose-6-phosphate synthase [Alkalihalobacillus sp. AL-G]|uniref:3-hexulose-6-phosphate synthase n=1 Tax=Alkalihalobacillus sp. AL-G TaxID=2926399 RepID=UPI00272CFD74|nr:3-hexulose-6-phosphate synthase [Alkalihalobacillus sp. AL-G]WLD93336.1 orotidine 5'-phosphate decarboxylase [Alkalihalobacillus sp. AL-G]